MDLTDRQRRELPADAKVVTPLCGECLAITDRFLTTPATAQMVRWECCKCRRTNRVDSGVCPSCGHLAFTAEKAG